MPATWEITKKFYIARDTKKCIQKGGMKNEKYKKSLTTKRNFFTFIFCIWKRIYFVLKHSLGKCSLHYYISSKYLFSVAGYLKQSNKTPSSI